MINPNLKLKFENDFLRSKINNLMKDPKTGLWNMHASNEIEKYLDKYRDIKYTTIILDIDNFKQINDNFSHIVGDKVIVNLSKLIQNWFYKVFKRKSDFFLNISNEKFFGLRFGGEEFVIILIGIYEKDMIFQMVENLRNIINETIIKLGNESLSITCSYGISTSYDTSVFKEKLLHADLALLDAKKSGKNKFCFWKDN